MQAEPASRSNVSLLDCINLPIGGLRIGLIQALALVKIFVAILMLLSASLAPAATNRAFEEATSVAYRVLAAQAAKPMCSSSVVADADRRALVHALGRISSPGLSEPLGLSPLDYAVVADDVATINRLVALGYPVQGPRSRLLYGAVLAGSERAVAHLLSQGADADGASGSTTPLMVAAHENRIGIARALLAAGASPTPRSNGVTALHYALVCKNQEMVDLLLEAGAERDSKAEALASKYGLRLAANER